MQMRTLSIVLGLISAPAMCANTWHMTELPPTIKQNIQHRLTEDSLSQGCNTSQCQDRLKQQIKQAIAPFGYYQPRISIDGKLISVELGSPVRISQIDLTFTGPGRELFTHTPFPLPIQVGDVLQTEKYLDCKRQLLEYAEAHGYLRAYFEVSRVRVNLSHHQAVITLKLSTQQRYYFGPINFSHTGYDPQFLSRYLPLKIGQPFDHQLLLELNDRLNNSGYFNSVVITPQIGETNHVPTNVYLKDKPTHEYTVGGGFGTDTGIRGRLSWKWLRVNPQGHSFQTIFQGSQTQNNLQARYLIPGKQPDRSQTTLSASIFQLNYPVGNSHAQRLSINQRFQDKRWLYNLGLHGLRESFNYIDGDKQYQTLIYPNLRISWRDISSPLFSKSGIAIFGETRTSLDGIASSISFWQIQTEVKAATWLPTQSRLLGRINIGTTAVDDIYQLPLSIQQLAGGVDNLRGYHYQGVGPGKHLLAGSIEWQQLIRKNWFLCGFYDIGDVYQPTPLSLKRDLGLGVMWISPVGPVRAYLAKAVDDIGQPYRLAFSMGPDL